MEFALLFPFIIFIVFGVIQFGLAMSQQASLASGAREGARIATVNTLEPVDCAEIITRVQVGAATIGMSADQVSVRIERLDTPPSPDVDPWEEVGEPMCDSGSDTAVCLDAEEDSRIRVVASFPDKTIVIPPFLAFEPFDLESVGVYRCEYS